MHPASQQILAQLRQAVQQVRDDANRYLVGPELAATCAHLAPATPDALLELLHESDYESGLYQSRKDAFNDVYEAQICIRWLLKYEHPIGMLQHLGFNSDLPWFVRQEAFSALQECSREDLEAEFDWLGLMSLLDSDVEGEVKSACLDLLVHGQRRDALPRLQQLSKSNLSSWYDGKLRLTAARAALGDNRALLNMIQESYNPWSSRALAAKQALDAAAQQLGGVAGVARAVAHQSGMTIPIRPGEPWLSLQQHPTPEVARWAADCGELPVETLLAQLASDHWGLRQAASGQLARTDDRKVDGQLGEILLDESRPQRDRSWAAYTLLKRDSLAQVAPKFPELPALRIIWETPWPFQVPSSVRDAVVLEYAPESEEGSDIRYQIEHALTYRPTTEDQEEARASQQREQLIAALEAAGVVVASAQSCGEAHQQGGGTYWILNLGEDSDANRLFVSTLGPFVSYVQTERQGSAVAWSVAQSDEGSEARQCRQVAEELDMLWLGDAVLNQTVPGLNVYFFGSREPLSLHDLLFYWQD